jgi:hypothetical protein
MHEINTGKRDPRTLELDGRISNQQMQDLKKIKKAQDKTTQSNYYKTQPETKTETKTETIPIREVERANENAGKHFFSKSSKRFFNSRNEQYAIKKNDDAYFISSEKYENKPRKYTARKMNMKNGNVDTLGEFNQDTKAQAKQRLKQQIKTDYPND